MPKLYQPSPLLLILIGLFVYPSFGCNRGLDLKSQSAVQVSPTASGQANPTKPNAVPAAPVRPTTSKTDPFHSAMDRASSAYRIGKSAQSGDDWRLVEQRWQQAIELIKSVPASSPYHAQVKQKLAEYQQNLIHAQQQANRPTTIANPNGVIVLAPQNVTQPKTAPEPIAAAVPQMVTPTSSTNQSDQRNRFYAPIIRREGNTPVVRVMFNTNQPFDMIVDTGASGTLITRQMASTLGVVPVAQANVDTASQRGVSFPLGYVRSIEVGGVVASNVLVAVAGPELDIGLLGHDFFGHYDVTIRATEVEFQER